jgi:ribosomal protein S18 acetylase RimI-like enzyme
MRLVEFISTEKLIQGQIVPFRPNRDKPRILRIEIQRFDDPMSNNMLNYLISKYSCKYFYVVDINGDQNIDGFLFAGNEGNDELHVFSIALQIEYENQGWGSRLFNHLIEKAKLDSVKKIGLHVETNNTKAINLYRKFRFKQIKISSNYYGKNRDALVMELML